MSNRMWFLATYADCLSMYVRSYDLINGGEFYKAWCELERCEIAIETLKNNLFYKELSPALNFLEGIVRNWQELYPYKVFISPEIVIKAESCSVCGRSSGPWGGCPHRTKKVYCGRLCYRIVKKAEFRGMSLVLEPVQKYSVVRILNEDGSDQFSYDMVKWVAERIKNPFHAWSIKDGTRLAPHSEYSKNSMEGDCPCGSARSYSFCCARKAGVVKRHCQIWFEYPPPKDLPNFVNFEN